MKTKASIGGRIFNIVNVCIMIFLIAITVYPFWNQVILSFAERQYLYAVEPQWYPKSFDFSSYKAVLKYKDLWTGYLNTLIRMVVGTLCSLLVTAMCAYPLTKQDLPGRKVVNLGILFTMLFGGGLIPSYLLIMNTLHLGNTIWALILPGLCGAYNVFIMRNFFQSIPDALEEAALIDGAGYFRIFWQIVLPLSKPVLATVALWMAVGHWQAWYDNLLYLQNPNKWGLQMVLRELLVSNQSTNIQQAVSKTFGSITAVDDRQLKSAVIVVSMIPVLIICPIAQRFMSKGIVLGAVKG